MTDTRDFFISYNSADAAHADAINAALRDAGYTTHYAGTDLPLGSNIAVWMDNALFTSTQVLALCSPDYFKPEAVYSEAERSAAFWADPVGAQQKLIPVEIRPSNYPPLYAALRRVVSTSGMLPQEAGKALLVEMQRMFEPRQPDIQSIPTPMDDLHGVGLSTLNAPIKQDKTLTSLHDILSKQKRSLPAVVVVSEHRLSRTVLASDYVQLFGSPEHYAGVWWIQATNHRAVVDGLAHLAVRFGEAMVADIPALASAALSQIEALDADRGRDAARPWLLIYDGLPEASVLRVSGEEGARRKLWIPDRGARIIVTSSRFDAFEFAETMELRTLSEDQSVQVILGDSGRVDRSGAIKLAEELSGVERDVERSAEILANDPQVSIEEYTKLLGYAVELVAAHAQIATQASVSIQDTESSTEEPVVPDASGKANESWLVKAGADLRSGFFKKIGGWVGGLVVTGVTVLVLAWHSDVVEGAKSVLNYLGSILFGE
ncbi:MAG: toll/interleukin-1 receptor domain-containing protein [Pseudomonadota bacterium]